MYNSGQYGQYDGQYGQYGQYDGQYGQPGQYGQQGQPVHTKSSSSNTIMYIIFFICILYYCTLIFSICTSGILYIYKSQQATKLAANTVDNKDKDKDKDKDKEINDPFDIPFFNN